MSPADATLNQSSPTNLTGVGTHNFSCSDMKVQFLLWQTIGFPSGFLGLLASVWLLWVLIQRQRNGASDIYMLNLTIINLIINIVVSQNTLYFWFTRRKILSHISDIIYFYCMNGQALMMACICVDCYIAVVQPITYMNLKHSRYRLVVCGLVWGLSFIYGISMSFTKFNMTSLRVIPYILSLPTIAVSDLSVLHALRKPDPSGRKDVHPQKRRALQIVTNSLIITVVAFLPPLVIFMLFPLVTLSVEVRMCYMIELADIAPLAGSTIMSLLNLSNMGVLNSLKRVLCVLKYFKEDSCGRCC